MCLDLGITQLKTCSLLKTDGIAGGDVGQYFQSSGTILQEDQKYWHLNKVNEFIVYPNFLSHGETLGIHNGVAKV